MKKISIFLFFTTFTLCSIANTIKGVVVDANDSEPLPGALCSVFTTTDVTTPVGQFVTDENGAFSHSIVNPGQYRLRILYTGFAEKFVDFETSATSAETDLGTISLSEDSQTLNEVTVTGRRPLIQANGERVTYNVTEDPESGTNTVMEMLRKVPLVSVDGQDNITVNGQSSFKIYINGRENPMLNSNPKEILKSMPATAVQKIEVITEPGAKYDAEGVGGILNIVTEGAQSPVGGYLLKLGLDAENTSAGANIYLLKQIRKVNASFTYDINRDYDNRKRETLIERESFQPTPLKTVMDGYQKDRNMFQMGSMVLSWEPDTNNLFNVSANLMIGSGSTPFEMLQTVSDGSGTLISGFSQKQKSTWDWGHWSASANYQHSFARKDHNIVLSYLYNHGVNTNDSKMWYEEPFNIVLPDCQYNENRNPTNEHTVQFDYTNAFSQKHTIELGAKGIFRRNSSDAKMMTGPDLEHLVENPANASSLKQFQDVAAVYGSYSGTFGKWSTKAGVRYEYTHMGVDFTKGPGTDFSTNLNDVVPNAGISFNLTPMSVFRLAYQMRISRPGVQQLNPFRDDSNPLEVRYGNPNLTSEHSNNVSLTFSDFSHPVGINLSVGYNNVDNPISEYSYSEGNTVYSTYVNSGRAQTVNFNAYLNFRIFRKVTWSVHGGMRYENLSYDEAGIRNHGWGGNLFADLDWQMPGDIRMNVYGGFHKMGPRMQMRSNSTFKFYGISFKREFLPEKRLEVSVSVNNFFGPMKLRMETWTENSRTLMNVNIPTFSYGIAVSYRFGGNAKEVKRVSSSIVNDDMQTGSSGGNTSLSSGNDR